jgi:hypothetical protein
VFTTKGKKTPKNKEEHTMTEKTARQIEAIKNDYNFGVEVEMNHITRQNAAKVAAEFFGTGRYENTAYRNGYMTWSAFSADGREWKFSRDVSIAGPDDEKTELVTPILEYGDIPMLQTVVRALRQAGARAGGGAGLHIHVGAAQMTPKQIQNLVKIFYKQEELIVKGCGTAAHRLGWYTRRTDRQFVDKMLKIRNPTMANLADAYYHGENRYSHYSNARYRTLNLHNLWNGNKHTVEFRLFEATTHAGEIRTNVLLALTIVHKAMDAKAASARRPRPYSEASARYDLRVFLLRLGWIGEMFKAPRKHLLKRMPGSAAWKDGRHD